METFGISNTLHVYMILTNSDLVSRPNFHHSSVVVMYCKLKMNVWQHCNMTYDIRQLP